ncbi:hypothetical protein H8D36_01835 [archaeon]|nr:hypothetical protein [archaeon]MBL7057419.1 hypothetical protein [Candidatus Woesearchaeota archaeon]
MKGQVSVEFLIIMAFAFILIIPVLILFLIETNNINQDVTAAQVNKLADELLDAVDNVYYLGAPTQKTLNIYIPDYVEEAMFVGNQIRFNVSPGAFSYIIVRAAATNITGSLNTNNGMHSIKITAVDETVNIEG